MMEVVNDLEGDVCIPENFSLTVPSYNPSHPQPNTQPSYLMNPQTTELCATLGLTDIYAKAGQSSQARPSTRREDEDNSGSSEEFPANPADTSELSCSYNPDEIVIEDEWDEDKGAEEGISGEKGTDEMLVERAVGLEDVDSEYSSLLSGSHTELVLPPPLFIKAEVAHQSQGFLSLQLPLPTQSTCDSQDLPHMDLEGCTSHFPSKVHKRSSDEKDVGKNITNKIKRRNQAIYESKEDEEHE